MCRDCIHFTGRVIPSDPERGACKRYPPVIRQGGDTDHTLELAVFPITHERLHCGEFSDAALAKAGLKA